jgi:hypothetical protein
MKLLFPKQNYNVLSPSSYTHISVRDLYMSRIGLPILLQGSIVYVDQSWEYKTLTDTWMWKLGLRPRNSQKRNTKIGIFLAVYQVHLRSCKLLTHNCIAGIVSYCRDSHQLCLMSCSGLQTLSSIVSHCLFHIADTLIDCIPVLVTNYRHCAARIHVTWIPSSR